MFKFLRSLLEYDDGEGEREEGDTRFHTKIYDRYKWSLLDWTRSTYIKVDEYGKVVTTGNPIWGREGQVHWIGLPWVFVPQTSSGGSRDIHSTLTYTTSEGAKVSVGIAVEVFFSDLDFDYQELFDKVIPGGHGHIDNWIVSLFCEAALADSKVGRAFEKYMKNERPALLVESLGVALKALPFSGRVLKNVTKIAVRPKLDVVVSSEAVYNGEAR
jgi:hypothetical protein